MRICIIGNSHILAPHGVLTAGAETTYSSVKPTFFTERRHGLLPLKIQGGGDEIKINDLLLTRSLPVVCSNYDAFVIFGLDFSLISLSQFWMKYRPYGHGLIGNPQHTVSAAFFEEAALSLSRQAIAVRTLNAIRGFSDRPLFLVPSPLPMHWAISSPLGRTKFIKAVVEAEQQRYLLSTYNRGIEDLRKSGIVVIDPPANTVINDFFTDPQFGLADPSDESEGSIFSRGDYFHANETYAQMVLGELLENRLGSGPIKSLAVVCSP